MTTTAEPFTAQDFRELAGLVLDAWRIGAGRDWSARAGTLEWSCLETADHTIDCIFSYAFFLASTRQDAYPPFGELHALPGAGPSDLLDGLRAVTTMLWSVIVTAAPDDRAILFQGARSETGTPPDFAARGGLELILHAHDVCAGLEVVFVPPPELCDRLWHHTDGWPGQGSAATSDDRWADLLARSGRPRPS